MHIPKTSGSTMGQELRKALNPKSYFAGTDRCVYAGMPSYTDKPLPQADCYVAHASLHNLMKYRPDAQFITVFREASARVLSHWVYWRSTPDEKLTPANEWRKQHRMSLVETLLDTQVACQFDNISLRMLVWPHRAIPDVGFISKNDDAELLELALGRLKNFHYIDVLENPRFKENLSEWLDHDTQYEPVNVTSTMPKHARIDLQSDLTPEALDVLEDRSRLDQILWKEAAGGRLPGYDLNRLMRDTLLTNIVRYAAIP